MTGTARAAGIGEILREGLRTVVFLNPRWQGGAAGPTVVLCLVAAGLLSGAALSRLEIAGPAEHVASAWGTGWLSMVVLLLAAWLAARHGKEAVATPDAATALSWFLVQSLLIGLPVGVAQVLLYRFGFPPAPERLDEVWLGVVAVSLLWQMAAASVVVVRLLPKGLHRLAAMGVLVLHGAVSVYFPPSSLWYPSREALAADDGDDSAGPPPLTQEVFEAQSDRFEAALDGVLPERPGVTELYAITFAPYADEDVFSREVKVVGDVMRERFDADGRLVNLQNHRTTIAQVPWATPLNLQRAIARMAERMGRDEDILFIHLTSHGASDGRLAARFFPLSVEEVTPEQVRQWLDEAGVRYSVISISACYSGSWIAPLQSPGTLVMTAADATHTSYGCGRKSELTFYGRAMYAEQLRQTRSFQAAHEAALPVIDRREKEAGKNDGPSNPQIWVGPDIQPRLDALVRRLEGGAASR